MADPTALRNKIFDSQRQSLRQDLARKNQENQDVLQRRFASIGQSGSGASIGAEMNARRQVDEMGQRAIGDIEAQKAQSELQAADVEANRAWQSGEAEKGRLFQGGESEKGRVFQGGLADKDAALKREFFSQEQLNKAREYELAKQQFELDKDTTAFNRRMAELEANRKPPGMFDMFGIEGVSGPGDVMKSQIGSATNPLKAASPILKAGGK